MPITENGYPFKRIFKTDRVWSLVESFCEKLHEVYMIFFHSGTFEGTLFVCVLMEGNI